LRKPQKIHTPEEKISILRRYLVEKVPVSALCRETDIQPTVFYRWLEKLFKQGSVVFERGEPDRSRKIEQEKIGKLEKKIQQRDEAMAELMQEHVALKKAVGGL
jgi:transposase